MQIWSNCVMLNTETEKKKNQFYQDQKRFQSQQQSQENVSQSLVS